MTPKDEFVRLIEEDGEYKLYPIWHPGSWECPQDGDVEWKAQKVKK